MAAMGDYLEEKSLDLILNGNTFLTDGDLLIALYNTDPGEDLSGTQVSGGGYARVVIDSSGGDKWTISEPVSGEWQGTNISAITFPAATGAWTTINFVAVLTALGQLLYKGPVGTARTLAATDVYEIDAGVLVIKHQ